MYIVNRGYRLGLRPGVGGFTRFHLGIQGLQGVRIQDLEGFGVRG